MMKIKAIVEGAKLVVERVGKNKFKIHGIELASDESFLCRVGETITICLPPVIQEREISDE